MRRVLIAAVVAAVSSVTLAVCGVAPVGAAVPLPGVVSATPVPWTPNVFAGTSVPAVCQKWFGSTCKNATLYSTAVVNGEVVVAGAFTQVCQPGSVNHCQAGTLVTRDDVFAYQLGTGVIDPNFKPQLDQGPAFSVAAGPGNTVYIGGSFTTVNGASHRGLVQVNVTPGTASTDGQVVAAFTGNVSRTVHALAYRSNALYVGGEFTAVDSAHEDGIARLNATTGALDATFGMSIGTPAVPGLALKVNALSLSQDGSTLAIAGTFADVNGQSRPKVALISTGGGLGAAASLANWAAPILRDNCSKQHDNIRGIDISPDGSFLVLAATGYLSAPRNAPGVCDAVARFPTAPTGTNIAPTWINYAGGDSFYSAAITGGVVYAGGHNRWANNECGNNHACEANSVLVMGMTAIDASTGLALPWFQPLTDRGNGVMSLTSFPAGLFAGSKGGLLMGNNVSLNGGGAFHSFEALFPLTSATSTPPTFGPVPSGMFSQGRIGGFNGHGGGVAEMCIDDPNNSTTPGTPVTLSTCTNGAEQNVTVQAGGSISVHGLCLGLSVNTVVVNLCDGAPTQQWSRGTGNRLTNNGSGQCLTDPGSSTKNGTVLQIAACTGGANQAWPLPAAPVPPSLTPAGPVSVSVPAGDAQPACLNAPGTAVTVWTCSNDQAQHATLAANGTIAIRGLCLDTKGGATAPGTAVTLNTCGSSATQVWTPGIGHALVNKASGLCLNATSQTNGAPVTIAGCTPSSVNQKWWLPAV